MNLKGLKALIENTWKNPRTTAVGFAGAVAALVAGGMSYKAAAAAVIVQAVGAAISDTGTPKATDQ